MRNWGSLIKRLSRILCGSWAQVKPWSRRRMLRGSSGKFGQDSTLPRGGGGEGEVKGHSVSRDLVRLRGVPGCGD